MLVSLVWFVRASRQVLVHWFIVTFVRFRWGSRSSIVCVMFVKRVLLMLEFVVRAYVERVEMLAQLASVVKLMPV